MQLISEGHNQIWKLFEEHYCSANAISVKPDPYPWGPMHIELKEIITFVLICRLESLSKLTCFPIRLCLNIGHFWKLGWVGFGPAWTYFCLEKVKRFPSMVLTVGEPHIRSINKEGSLSLLGGLPCLHIINAFNSLVNRCIQLIASI